MSTELLVLLIVGGVLLAATLIVGLVFLILFLVRQIGGTRGGWRKLLEAYATTSPPGGQTVTGQTLQIGAVVYKRCATLGVADDGLYVSIGRNTARIPWSEFKQLGEATLYWRKVPMLTIGDPPAVTMTIPVGAIAMIWPKLTAAV